MHQDISKKAPSASLSIWTLIEAIQKEHRTTEADQQQLRLAPATLSDCTMMGSYGGVGGNDTDQLITSWDSMTQRSLPSLSEVVQQSRSRRVSLSVDTLYAPSSISFAHSSPESPLSAPTLHYGNTSPTTQFYSPAFYNKDDHSSARSSQGPHHSFLKCHHQHSFESSKASSSDDPKKRYMCNICNKRFSRPSSLTQHMRTHTGERELKAQIEESSSLYLKLRPDDRFCHAIAGNNVPITGIVLKLRKRRNRSDPSHVEIVDQEIVGVADKVYRFREIADFQYSAAEPHFANLHDDLLRFDVDRIATYNADIDVPWTPMPPAVFSRIPMSCRFDYREGTAEGAEEKDPSKFIAHGIDFNSPLVPSQPTQESLALKSALPQKLIEELTQMFEERPVWTRSQLSRKYPDMETLKHCLVFVGYYFRNGVWRNCWVRFNYDPRKDPQAKMYQTLDFRNYLSAKVRQSNSRTKSTFLERSTKILARLITDDASGLRTVWQMCDLKEGPLKQLCAAGYRCREECDFRDGWFARSHMEAIRLALKDLLDTESVDDDVFVKKWIQYVSENDNGDEPPSKLEILKNATGKRRERLLNDEVNNLMENLENFNDLDDALEYDVLDFDD